MNEASIDGPSCQISRENSSKSLALQEVRKKKKRTQSFKQIYQKGIELKSRVKEQAEQVMKEQDAEIEAKRPDQSNNRYLASLKLAKQLFCCFKQITNSPVSLREMKGTSEINQNQFF